MTELGFDRWGTVAPAWAQSRRRWARRLDRARVRLGLLATAAPRMLDPLTLSLSVVGALTLLFLLFPQIDLAATDLFYRVGEGFPASRDPLLRAFRESSDFVLIVLVLGLIARLVRVLVRRGGAGLMAARRSIFLLAAFAAGPGLVVNGVLKSWWGRPRPVGVDLFGGDAPYQTVWRISDWCQSNCSFVSGEGALAAWFVAVLVLVPGRYRLAAAAPTVFYATLLSVNRLAFGGHFLSDVLLSWAISAVVFALLYRVMVSAPGVARRARVWRGLVPAAV
jgi:membrane-associated PAP2 superfamily phosphatase